jgi:hypothetical protein
MAEALKQVTINAKDIDLSRVRIAVSNDIASKGYLLASTMGEREPVLRLTDGIGILKANRQGNNGIISKLLRGESKADFVATLWFDDNGIKTSRSNWCMEIYGRKNLAEMELLAERISSAYNAVVHVHTYERERKETSIVDITQ